MSQYQLGIWFDDEGLKSVRTAKQYVTLVKSIGVGNPVAWVSFVPQLENHVTWVEDYSVYASTSQIINGAQIVTSSIHKADGGNLYTLTKGNFDKGKTDPDLQGTDYGVLNSDPELVIGGVKMVTSGLYQGAVVNGTQTASPLNAAAIPYNDTGIFTPVEKVLIFASAYQNNGLVISSVSSKALEVDLTDKPTQMVYYNHVNNRFALGPLPS